MAGRTSALSGAPSRYMTEYWLTAVSSVGQQTAEQLIETMVGQEHIFAIPEKASGRKHMKPDDWICFHVTGKGVVAHAQIASAPNYTPHHPKVGHPEKFPWTIKLQQVELYLNNPVPLASEELRSNLDEFRHRDLKKPWSWWILSISRLSSHDFNCVTRRAGQSTRKS